MKRIALILAAFLIGIGSLFAQKVEASFGLDDMYDLPRYNSYQKIVGADKDGFYALRVNEANDIILEYWGMDNMTRETENPLILPSNNGIEAEFHEMFYLNGNLILFTTVTNQSIKQKTLYVQHVNKSGKIIGESKAIGRLTNQNIVVPFNVLLTEDKSSMFVYYHRPFQAYNGEPYFLKIYNPQLEEIMNKVIKLPLKDREFEVIQYKVLGNHDILMLAKVKPQEERRRRRYAIAYEYKLLRYDVDLVRVDSYDMSVEKYQPKNAWMGVNEKEQVVDIFGFMARKRKEEFSGIYHEQFDLETKEWAPIDRKETYLNFDRNDEFQFRSEHLFELRDQVYNYKIRDVVYLSNDDPVFIAEHENFWQDSVVDPQTQAVEYSNYYKFNDIIAAKVNADNNKMEWSTRIPKSQYSYNDYGDYSSFAYVAEGEKVKFFYNDHRKNLKMLANDLYRMDNLKVIRSPQRRGRAISVTLFSDGKIYGSYMFDKKHKKLVIKPELLVPYRDAYYVYMEKGNNFQFAKFNIE